MNLGQTEAVNRFKAARVAHLATVSGSGQPHIVPVTFDIRSDVVVIAVDQKPKTTTNLKRLRNIRETARVSILADQYDDQNWSRLWWVRIDGVARVIDDDQERAEPVGWLCEKYPQYREDVPAGPVIWIDIDDVRGWAYAD